MFRLIESIRLFNGKFHNLEFHQERMDRSLTDLYQTFKRIELTPLLGSLDFPRSGVYKCRVEYDHQSHRVEFVPYTFRSIKSLKKVESNSLSYEYKFSNRSGIDRLMKEKGNCDDILIIKNNFVCDCSYANIVFKKKNQWFTPKTYLLRGTMRESLLKAGRISELEIEVNDIQQFEKFKLINAMLGFDSPECDISNIF